MRLSGPGARGIVARTCTVDGRAPELGPRGAARVRFHDGRGEQPALLLWMPGPRSFTREDVAELHLPGAAPLLGAALERVLAEGAEPAEPGEFTRRAFLHGRIDLSRAQGVLALVSARTRAERRAASALVSGGLDERTRDARAALEELRASCESSLDFDASDTGHVPEAELFDLGARARARLTEAARWEESRARTLGAPRVVLLGAPNAGKSRLFNVLTGEERALVSDHPGTTRDVLRATWRAGGTELLLCDTAGSDADAEGVDATAQSRARRERESADLTLFVVDAPAPAERARAPRLEGESPRLLVWNKIDLAGARPMPPDDLLAGCAGWAAVSAASGQGLGELARAASALFAGEAQSAGLGRELAGTYRLALGSAASQLERALADLERGVSLDLVAESLRLASASLDRIDGRTTPEDLLDRIFARFCIGK